VDNKLVADRTKRTVDDDGRSPTTANIVFMPAAGDVLTMKFSFYISFRHVRQDAASKAAAVTNTGRYKTMPLDRGEVMKNIGTFACPATPTSLPKPAKEPILV
jgi:hypothetical protein